MSQNNSSDELVALEGDELKFFTAISRMQKEGKVAPFYVPEIAKEAGLSTDVGARIAKTLINNGYASQVGNPSAIILTAQGEKKLNS